MARFFFDIDDGRRQVRDETGIDLASIDDVECEAKLLLLNLGEAELLKGRPRVFKTSVRDEAGGTIYRGSVTLRIRRG